jgi:flagella basal body P-ring formation protein FlgA
VKRFTILTLLFISAAIQAAPPREEPEQIGRTARQFLEQQTIGLPGAVAIEIGKIDERVSLAACDQSHAFFPAGSRAWGKTSVGVRCAAPTAWTIYVSANIKVSADYLVAARPLALGQEIGTGDFSIRHGELTQLPAGVLTDATQAIGHRLANSVQAGQPLRRDAVRAPPAVQAGQAVALIVQGNGFKVSSEGHALGKAPEGELVQVKTAGGSVVSGVVRAGPIVEIIK